MPELQKLKVRLMQEGKGLFTSVFMSGNSTNTVMRVNDDKEPDQMWFSEGHHPLRSSSCRMGAGSGSTIVCFGSDEAPAFLKEEQYSDTLVKPARLMARQPHGWYEPSS